MITSNQFWRKHNIGYKVVRSTNEIRTSIHRFICSTIVVTINKIPDLQIIFLGFLEMWTWRLIKTWINQYDVAVTNYTNRQQWIQFINAAILCQKKEGKYFLTMHFSNVQEIPSILVLFVWVKKNDVTYERTLFYQPK